MHSTNYAQRKMPPSKDLQLARLLFESALRIGLDPATLQPADEDERLTARTMIQEAEGFEPSRQITLMLDRAYMSTLMDTNTMRQAAAAPLEDYPGYLYLMRPLCAAVRHHRKLYRLITKDLPKPLSL